MDIINHTTKDVCKLKYFQYSYFSKDIPRKVTGVITDANSQARWVLSGKKQLFVFLIFHFFFIKVHGLIKLKEVQLNQIVIHILIIWKHII
jgi:hypothetical protein